MISCRNCSETITEAVTECPQYNLTCVCLEEDVGKCISSYDYSDICTTYECGPIIIPPTSAYYISTIVLGTLLSLCLIAGGVYVMMKKCIRNVVTAPPPAFVEPPSVSVEDSVSVSQEGNGQEDFFLNDNFQYFSISWTVNAWLHQAIFMSVVCGRRPVSPDSCCERLSCKMRHDQNIIFTLSSFYWKEKLFQVLQLCIWWLGYPKSFFYNIFPLTLWHKSAK